MHKKLFNSFLIITLCFSSINLFANALPNFKPLVEKNSAAVVNISTTIKSSGGISPGLNMPDIPEKEREARRRKGGATRRRKMVHLKSVHH